MFDSFELIIDRRQEQRQELEQQARQEQPHKTSDKRPVEMCWKLNNKQILIMALGMCILGAVISFGIWAATGGLNRSVQKVPESPPLIRTGIPADIRRVFKISQNKTTGQEPKFGDRMPTVRPPSTNRRPMPIPTMDSRPTPWPSEIHEPVTTSFLDLPNAPPSPAVIQSRADVNQDDDLPPPPANSTGNIDWEIEAWNIAKMLKVVSETFGVEDADQVHRPPPVPETAQQHKIRNDRSSWVSLSYLSLGMFLLNQMDRLLKLSPEGLDPNASFQRRSLGSMPPMISGEANSEELPWRYNSLNILFADPKELMIDGLNGTSSKMESVIENVVDNTRNQKDKSFSDYARVLLNVLKASQNADVNDGKHIDCIWNAYCIELNNRGTLEGIAGAMARMNGVFFRLMAGFGSADEAVFRMIHSLVKWQDLNCRELFPTCQSIEALNYMVELATEDA